MESITPNKVFASAPGDVILVVNKELDHSIAGFIYVKNDEYFALNLEERPELPYGPYNDAQEAFDDVFGAE